MKSIICAITVALATAEDKWVYKASAFGATQTPLLQEGKDFAITVSWGSTTYAKPNQEHVILWMGTEVGGAKITSGDMI